MKEAGQVVVFRLPQTDLEEGKLRPALLLGKLPGNYDDWLICMISSQTRQVISGFDEIVQEGDHDFGESGLKVTSVIRVGRLAVVSGDILLGAIGKISSERLLRVKKHLADWLSEK
ncbi:MAG TPA: type II toxin-antitoxin system PemK/MazF family toxin [Anaerolineales bacterium]|nr:type II toxin-antitoxin system PemK/MazF family toxin [Anaerolineales bacterium]